MTLTADQQSLLRELTTKLPEHQAELTLVVEEWARAGRDRNAVATRAGLADARKRGVKLGRPSSVPPELVTRMRRYRSRGMSYNEIARILDRDGIPTGQGAARWSADTVNQLVNRKKGRSRT